MAAGKFVLAKLEEQVELQINGVGPGAAANAVDAVAGKYIWCLVEQAIVKGGWETKTAVNPALEDGSFDGVGVDGPASQEADIAVAQAATSVMGVLFPLMQCKLNGKVFVENHATAGRAGFCVKEGEKPAVVLEGSANVEWCGIFLEIQRSNRPWRAVAEGKDVWRRDRFQSRSGRGMDCFCGGGRNQALRWLRGLGWVRS